MNKQRYTGTAISTKTEKQRRDDVRVEIWSMKYVDKIPDSQTQHRATRGLVMILSVFLQVGQTDFYRM